MGVTGVVVRVPGSVSESGLIRVRDVRLGGREHLGDAAEHDLVLDAVG
jgi:hypothetical protein